MASDRELLVRVLTRWFAGVLTIAAMLLLPAGTWAYWPAWLYMGVTFLPMLGVVVYLRARDPGLLERRMQWHEGQARQRALVGSGGLIYIAGFLIPGFDHRYGWSSVPTFVIVASALIVLAGYALFVVVLRANSYAARTVRVEQDQPLIRTGPYAWVRHPMYSAVSLMTLFTPTTLGSYWALLAFGWMLPLLVVRIRGEEAVLRRELAGYPEYCEQVRYRLVPGIW
ncbi:methyltransferase family protein [Nannocystaceae bacterium ST9]